MSEVELISTGIPNLLPMKGRSPGIHHSDVLSDLLVRMGHFPPKTPQNSKSNPHVITRMQLGQAFEEILVDRYSRHYPDRYILPGEFEIDGLPITPDLIDSSLYGPDSIKLTWLSSSHDILIDKFDYHWMQLMSECVALKTDTGRLHICHIMGSYDYETGVHFNVWQRRFSKQKLDSHKTLILRHRDRMLREGWKPESER